MSRHISLNLIIERDVNSNEFTYIVDTQKNKRNKNDLLHMYLEEKPDVIIKVYQMLREFSEERDSL